MARPATGCGETVEPGKGGKQRLSHDWCFSVLALIGGSCICDGVPFCDCTAVNMFLTLAASAKPILAVCLLLLGERTSSLHQNTKLSQTGWNWKKLRSRPGASYAQKLSRCNPEGICKSYNTSASSLQKSKVEHAQTSKFSRILYGLLLAATRLDSPKKAAAPWISSFGRSGLFCLEEVVNLGL